MLTSCLLWLCSREAGQSSAGWTWIDPAGQVFGLGRAVDVLGDRERLLVTRASRP
jgi:hypothetical protein